MRQFLAILVAIGALIGAARAQTNPNPTLHGAILDGWTTGTRPASPPSYQFGFNSTLGNLDVWNGAAWVNPCLAGGTCTVGVSFLSCASCDLTGATDSTAAANAFLLANAGRIVTLPAGACILINTGNLVLQPGILQGPSGVLGGVAAGAGKPCPTTGGGFKINPAFTVYDNVQGVVLQNFGIWRSTLTSTPAVSDVETAAKTWWNERSIGFTYGPNAGGLTMTGMMIEGFHVCRLLQAGVAYFFDNYTDCTTSLAMFGGGDNTFITADRQEPFYGGWLSATSGAYQRYGASYYFGYAPTGWDLSQALSVGWPMGLVTQGAGVGIARTLQYEYIASWAPGNSTFPAEQNGVCAHITSQSTGVIVDHIGCGNGGSGGVYSDGVVVDDNPNTLHIDAPMIGSIPSGGTAIYGGGPTIVAFATITIGGTPAAGDTIAVTFSGSGIVGGPYTITLPVQADSTATEAQWLGYWISTERSELAHSHVSAIVSGSVVSVYWPQDATVTVSAVASPGGAGHVSVTNASGAAADVGSSGVITNADLSVSNVGTLIQLGNTSGGALAWQIDGIHVNNGTINLPSNWLVTPSAPKELYVSNLQWSPVTTAAIGATGGVGAAVGTGAFDNRGAVTEGAASGFTLTFVTPFPTNSNPTCTVTPQNGAAYGATASLSVSVSTTALTVSHAAATGAVFKWECGLNSHT